MSNPEKRNCKGNRVGIAKQVKNLYVKEPFRPVILDWKEQNQKQWNYTYAPLAKTYGLD